MKNKEKHFHNRDVQDVIEIIGGRWRGAILASLCDKEKRFNENFTIPTGYWCSGLWQTAAISLSGAICFLQI